MTPDSKRILTAIVSVLVITASALWIYWREFRAPQHDVGLHQRVGEVMAEQTAKVAGKKGKIVVITIPTRGLPELETQLDAFHKTLKKLGEYDLREYEMDTKDQPKYGVGTGLSGRRYVRTANKNTNTAVVVSFIGAPSMKGEDMADLQMVPKLVAQCRSVDDLPMLFQKQLITVAVAARFIFPAPGRSRPRTAQERFDKRYQVLVAENAGTIPKPEP